MTLLNLWSSHLQTIYPDLKESQGSCSPKWDSNFLDKGWPIYRLIIRSPQFIAFDFTLFYNCSDTLPKQALSNAF